MTDGQTTRGWEDVSSFPPFSFVIFHAPEAATQKILLGAKVWAGAEAAESNMIYFLKLEETNIGVSRPTILLVEPLTS